MELLELRTDADEKVEELTAAESLVLVRIQLKQALVSLHVYVYIWCG